ncbi:MAG TPA: hypothetical protein VGN42_11915 [Pirellulales bacterium]|jgi:hypothetical protein|nr:hypothetical protein [Pirellulales bacterium]
MDQGGDFDPLDPVLHEYFSSELKPQRGRALARFLRDGAAIPQAPLRRSARSRRWAMGAASLTAAAAVLLLAWNLEGRREAADESPLAKSAPSSIAKPSSKSTAKRIASKAAPLGAASKDHPPPGASTALVDAQEASGEERLLLVERATRSRTIDEGTVLIGQTAVRKLRRQWWERVEWFDPAHGARLERFVPREELSFVAIPVN